MEATSTASSKPRPSRFDALDSLRATAMLLGVVYHAILFGGGMMGMFGGSPGANTRVMDWIHSFRMPLFFMISGFFCHMMLTKHGTGKYLWRRWWRLGAAMVIYLFTVATINHFNRNSGFGGFGGGPGGPGGPGDGAAAGGASSERGAGISGPPGGGAEGRPPQGGPGPGMAGGPGGAGFGGRGGPGGGIGGPGGPGGFGGFGGPGGPGGPGGGPGGPGGFGPGMFLAPAMFSQANTNGDDKLSSAEFASLADQWLEHLDPAKSGKVSQEQFTEHFAELIPMPGGFGPPGGGPGGGFNPARFMAPGVFTALDSAKRGSLTAADLRAKFADWFVAWDDGKSGLLSQDQLRDGLNKALAANGPGGGFGGPRGGGAGGRGGAGGGMMPFGAPHPLADRLFGSFAGQLNLGPMWFIWYLLVFATVAPALAWVVGRLVPSSVAQATHRSGIWAMRFALIPLALALLSLPGRFATTSYAGWTLGGATGIFQTFPDVLFSYQPDWPYYFAYFIVGWWLYSVRTSFELVAKTWVPLAALGFATYIGAVKMSETYASQTGLENYGLLRVVGGSLFALSTAFLSFGFLGFFQRYFNRPTKAGRYLADTAFWIYLLHQELLVQVILPRLRPYNLPWWAQTIIAVSIVTLIASITFELFIRRTPLTHLFGPPPPRKPPTNPTAPAPVTVTPQAAA